MDGGPNDQWPSNYFLNMSACDSLVGCGKVTKIANWGLTQAGAVQYDSKGTYEVSVLSTFYFLGTHTFLL